MGPSAPSVLAAEVMDASGRSGAKAERRRRIAAPASAEPPPGLTARAGDGSVEMMPQGLMWLAPALLGSGAWPVTPPSAEIQAAALLGPLVSTSMAQAPQLANEWIARHAAAGSTVLISAVLPPWPASGGNDPGGLVAVSALTAVRMTAGGRYIVIARPTAPFGVAPSMQQPVPTTPQPGFFPGFPAPAPANTEIPKLPDDAPAAIAAMAPFAVAQATYAVWKNGTAAQLNAAAAAAGVAGFAAAADVLRQRAAELAPAAPNAPAPTAATHKIKSGDTGRSVAKKYTNDPGRWREILDANEGMKTFTAANKSTQIKPWDIGQTINLPAGWSK